MTSKPKNFNAQLPAPVQTVRDDTPGSNAIVYVGENVITNDRVDLTIWLAKGIDDWVWATVGQLRAFLAAKTQSQASVISYGRRGMPTFFEFLLSLGCSYTPANLTPHLIEIFVTWLQTRNEWSRKTKLNCFTFVKTVLLGMRRRRLVAIEITDFPRNPFPNTDAGEPGERSLSRIERAHLADALKSDVIAIHHEAFVGSETDLLSVYILALALRTGLNTTPMLELTRDAIGPHPFIPKMRLLRSFKRRGKKTTLKALNTTQTDEEPTSIPLDGVALFEYALKRTESLIADASPRHRNCVWLFRVDQDSPDSAGKIRSLHTKQLSKGIARLVSRHGLSGDDGLPLRLNLSRLRKTMENRLWLLSDGDLFSVSLIMGHDPRVAEHSYLQVTTEMRQNATIVGEAMPGIYREGSIAAGPDNFIPIHLEVTPVGSCKNSLFGDKAPKDGKSHCIDFLSCFSCRSYAVVGAPEDLHRLYSFYWFLICEIERISSQEWKNHYNEIITKIDAFTSANFDKKLVEDAKRQAQLQPNRFWNFLQNKSHNGRSDNAQ